MADLNSGKLEEFYLQKLEENNGMCQDTLYNLAHLYKKTNRLQEAHVLMSKLSKICVSDEQRASSLFTLGQIMENMGDYAHAAEYYRQAYAVKTFDQFTRYYINNNLGYCLNQLKEFEEAKGYLLSALKIDPTRPNAYKNLGLCYWGMEEYSKAARCFIAGTRAYPADRRSLKHLEELINEHPELDADIPAFMEGVKSCKNTLELAQKMQPDFDAYWEELRITSIEA
jgi:tetratricopeptide (TPR) repeat protein